MSYENQKRLVFDMGFITKLLSAADYSILVAEATGKRVHPGARLLVSGAKMCRTVYAPETIESTGRELVHGVISLAGSTYRLVGGRRMVVAQMELVSKISVDVALIVNGIIRKRYDTA